LTEARLASLAIFRLASSSSAAVTWPATLPGQLCDARHVGKLALPEPKRSRRDETVAGRPEQHDGVGSRRDGGKIQQSLLYD
jgi:hypothetical protein